MAHAVGDIGKDTMSSSVAFGRVPCVAADTDNVISSLVDILTTWMKIYEAAEKHLVLGCVDDLAAVSAVEVGPVVKGKLRTDTMLSAEFALLSANQ